MQQLHNNNALLIILIIIIISIVRANNVHWVKQMGNGKWKNGKQGNAGVKNEELRLKLIALIWHYSIRFIICHLNVKTIKTCCPINN